MKIAVTSTGRTLESMLDTRFGRARYLIVEDLKTKELTVVDNTMNMNAAQGAGIQAAQNASRLGVNAIITGNVGPKAFQALNAAGIKVYLCEQVTVAEALQRYRAGELTEAGGANVQGHWAQHERR
jgi:predicted Fe-Mo cluster-binding NifX family protein